MSNTKLSDAEQAAAIREACGSLGWSFSVRNSILTIYTKFPPGDRNAFARCDSEAYSIVGLLRRTSPGSDWGTDGGSIGGMTGLNGGYYKLNRSGGSKRVLALLARG